METASQMIQAFECAHGSGAYGYDTALTLGKFTDERAGHGYKFAVHLMLAYGVALDRLECASTHMECELAAGYVAAIYCGEHLGGEMEPGGRGRYRAFDMAENGLIVRSVARFSASV